MKVIKILQEFEEEGEKKQFIIGNSFYHQFFLLTSFDKSSISFLLRVTVRL